MSINQHSRVSSQSSRSSTANVEKRIHTLQQTLKQILQNSNELKKLSQLQLSLPAISQTEKSIKQIQKDIDSSAKQLSVIHLMNEKKSLVQQTSSTVKMLKSSTKNIKEIKQSIKKLFDNLSQSRRTYQVNQNKSDTQSKSNLKYFLERNTKQITSILKRFQQNCLLLKIGNTNKQISSKIKDIVKKKRESWDEQLKKVRIQLGSIKCDAEYLNDRVKKGKVESKLKELVQLEPVVKDKELVLSIAEEEIELEDLDFIMDSNTIRIKKQMSYVSNQLNSLLQLVKKPLQQHQKQHLKRELLYLNDRWFKLKNVLKGYRKKYLVSMRQIQERLILINRNNKGNFKNKLKQLSDEIHQIHNRTQGCTKQFNKKQDELTLLYNAIQKIHKQKLVTEIAQQQ